MKIDSPSSVLYAVVKTEDMLDTRSARVARSKMVISSYIVFSRSTTGLARFRYSYVSSGAKSSAAKVEAESGPTS
jgi:hypothetical protein